MCYFCIANNTGAGRVFAESLAFLIRILTLHSSSMASDMKQKPAAADTPFYDNSNVQTINRFTIVKHTGNSSQPTSPVQLRKGSHPIPVPAMSPPVPPQNTLTAMQLQTAMSQQQHQCGQGLTPTSSTASFASPAGMLQPLGRLSTCATPLPQCLARSA